MNDQKPNFENQNKEDEDYGEIFFAWHFPEFPKYDRGRDWYVKAGIITFILLLFALTNPQLYFHSPFVRFSPPNFTFALLIILTALLVLLFHRSEEEVSFKITEDGILVNKKFYDYRQIKNFYIIYEPPLVKTLYFEPKSWLEPRIPIALVDQDPIKIREVLLQYLPEDLDREEEPASDQFSRTFKL